MTDELLDAPTPWGFIPVAMRGAYRARLAWERYLAEAKALGYTEREARMVAAGVYQIATKIPQPVDVLAEAREVLAIADFG
jgi:hypothetical protein